jgi:hypothetical protein
LIAAMLNVASGAMPGSATTQAIADAQAWMTANLPAGGKLPYGVSSSSAAGIAATSLSAALDSFNMGNSGVGHCVDGPGSGPQGGSSACDCGDGGGGGAHGDGGCDDGGSGKPPSIGSSDAGGVGGDGGTGVL